MTYPLNHPVPARGEPLSASLQPEVRETDDGASIP